MARRIVGAAVAVVAAVFVLVGVQGQAPRDAGTWMPASPMSGVREGAASVLLPDGRVMVLGGRDANGALPTAETYADGVWSTVPSTVERWGHTATALTDGRVLITGGETASGPTSLVELYDPDADTLTFAGTLVSPRKGHAATLLHDGRVLIAGGFTGDSFVNTVEIFDPADGSLTVAPFALSVARAGLSATTLLDGLVLFAGGTDGAEDLAVAEVVTVATGFVSPRVMSQPRRDHSAVLLPNNNTVLIAGGVSGGMPSASAEVSVPWLNQFRPTGAMAQPRYLSTLAALTAESWGSLTSSDGRAIAAGGAESSASELFSFAMLKSDKDDYSPGHEVYISGSGWAPNVDVTLLLRELPAEHASRTFTVTPDATGRFTNVFLFDVEDHHLDVRFYLTGTQSANGAERQARTTFTDSNPQAITVAAPTSVTVAQGGTANYGTLTLEAGGNSNPCDTTFSAEAGGGTGLPAGAGAQFGTNPLTTTGSDVTTTLSVSTLATTPTGTYTFRIAGTNSVPNGGQCQGSGPSNSALLTLIVTAGAVNTTTTVGSSLDPSTYGTSVTFTATVTAASGSNPSGVGTVHFKAGGSTIGSCSAVTLIGSTAQCGTSALPAATHSITAEYSGATGFNASTSDALSQVVSPRPVNLSGERVYDGNATAAASILTISNKVGSDDVTVASGSATLAGKNVGTQAIVSATELTLGGAQASNYSPTGATGSVTITAKGLTITATDQTKTYGDTVSFLGTEFTPDGLVNADAVDSVTLTSAGAAAGAAVGGHAIVASAAVGSGLGNYTITYVDGTLTVNAKALTVTASSPTVTFNDPVPAILPIYTGFVLGEDHSVLTTQPTCSTTYTVGSLINTYPSSCTGAASGNYSFTYVPGVVTVQTACSVFNGFLMPIGGSVETGGGGSYASPARSFRLNSTIPVKFSATCFGAPLTSGVHTLQAIKYSNTTTWGDAIDATPTDAATIGNQFRLTGSEWHFNMNTKDLGAGAQGIWLFKATLFDGSTYSVWVEMKK